MPGMDGLQLCKAIHTAHPKIQIIIISGYADFVYAQQCISYGVKGYCLKPIDAADLTACLNQAVRALLDGMEALCGELVESIACGDVCALRRQMQRSHVEWEYFYTAVSVGAPCFEGLNPEPFVIKLGTNNYSFSPFILL
ncbi:MAG: response regulator [Clostridia bacterium]|nr:response regulator [Clostridia bacterium]NLS85519.1 response regulator [Oscillospiraceae bacterium]